MKTKSTATEPTPKSRRLEVRARPGVSLDRMATDMIAEGEATNASTALRFVNAEHGELSLTDMVASLREHGEAINRGDFATVERMLNAQAVALNAMFAELARRAMVNMGTHLGATESYLRLALKAQSQSRATVETLAAIKNPPVVFARQANIAHGPQQVNNGPAPAAGTATGAATAPVPPAVGGCETLEAPAAGTYPHPTRRTFPPAEGKSNFAEPALARPAT